MIYIVVKGTPEEANHAAAVHGIGIAFAPSTFTGGRSELYADASVDDCLEDTIARWFCESGPAPFPPGTLLHYAHRPNGA